MDPTYGSPELGAGWHDAGQLERPSRIVTGKAQAIRLAARANGCSST